MSSQDKARSRVLPVVVAAVAVVLGCSGYALATGLGGQQAPQQSAPQNSTSAVQWCDDCGQAGHSENYCPTEVCTSAAKQASGAEKASQPSSGNGSSAKESKSATSNSSKATQSSSKSSSTSASKQWCDDCRTTAHDDDNCPREWCDNCGSKGHDDDACPTGRCDECGKTGHDDDRCPKAVCEDCGKTGHDDCD